MRIEYDPNLIEQTAFLAARGNGGREADLHAATDAVYAIPDATARGARFQEVHAAFFGQWRLGRAVEDHIAARPSIAECVDLCIIRSATGRRDEKADLYAKKTNGDAAPAGQTMIIQACPESLLDRNRLATWLPGELLHVADMLDARFGYRRETFEGPLARQNLVRDRYRVLWEIYVRGRLSRESNGNGNGDAGTGALRATWRRAFGDQGGQSKTAFDGVYGGTNLTHGLLMEWAARPETLPGETAGRSTAPGPRPGEPCPLCNFATYDWYVFGGDDSESIVNAARLRHPDWDPDDGACRQCAEIYAIAAADALRQ